MIEYSLHPPRLATRDEREELEPATQGACQAVSCPSPTIVVHVPGVNERPSAIFFRDPFNSLSVVPPSGALNGWRVLDALESCMLHFTIPPATHY